MLWTVMIGGERTNEQSKQFVRVKYLLISCPSLLLYGYNQARTGPAGYQEIPGGPVGLWADGRVS